MATINERLQQVRSLAGGLVTLIPVGEAQPITGDFWENEVDCDPDALLLKTGQAFLLVHEDHVTAGFFLSASIAQGKQEESAKMKVKFHLCESFRQAEAMERNFRFARVTLQKSLENEEALAEKREKQSAHLLSLEEQARQLRDFYNSSREEEFDRKGGGL